MRRLIQTYLHKWSVGFCPSSAIQCDSICFMSCSEDRTGNHWIVPVPTEGLCLSFLSFPQNGPHLFWLLMIYNTMFTWCMSLPNKLPESLTAKNGNQDSYKSTQSIHGNPWLSLERNKCVQEYRASHM